MIKNNSRTGQKEKTKKVKQTNKKLHVNYFPFLAKTNLSEICNITMTFCKGDPLADGCILEWMWSGFHTHAAKSWPP